ncbi:MAG: thiol-disulfide isomerase/thioredoxin/tetratricopeptide (TPR) repeat protein [Kiritimatiellia bacterium]|jgi:thiol-disulfide isomerase/thioredoxin/tetratricopeptide (TPR) repeat protein
MWTILLSVAMAGTPSASLTWKGDDVRLVAMAGPGEHVNDEGPMQLRAAWSDRILAYEGSGTELIDGLSLPAVRGHQVQMQLQLQVCTDDKSQCRVVDLQLQGQVPKAARKGNLMLSAVDEPHHEPAFHASWGGGDSAAQADKAMVKAKAEGKFVLLDFGAVWCPPCQSMAVEVLDSEDRPDVLDHFVVATLDADDPSSFEWKSRYKVGGYPTVVLTTPDGTEVDRQVGYGGREVMIEWLTAASADGGGFEAEFLTGPDAVTPERAAEVVLLLLDRHRDDDIAPWMERAAGAPEGVAMHLVRLQQEPTIQDADWLIDNAPDRTSDWLFGAMTPLSEVDGGTAVLDRAVLVALRDANGEESANLFYVMANLHEEQAQAYYAGAAAALRPAMLGPSEQRKPNVGWMATLLERSGDVDAAAKVLDDAVTDWPDEPSFYLSRGGLLLRAERHELALADANKALETGWGDNRLRAAKLKVDVLLALDRGDDARSVAKAELAKAAEVDEELHVRTFRYRQKLQAIVDGDDDK